MGERKSAARAAAELKAEIEHERAEEWRAEAEKLRTELQQLRARVAELEPIEQRAQSAKESAPADTTAGRTARYILGEASDGPR